MNRFLNSLILPKLNEEEFNNISRTKTNEIRIAIKNFPVKKKSRTRKMHSRILSSSQKRSTSNTS